MTWMILPLLVALSCLIGFLAAWKFRKKRQKRWLAVLVGAGVVYLTCYIILIALAWPASRTDALEGIVGCLAGAAGVAWMTFEKPLEPKPKP